MRLKLRMWLELKKLRLKAWLEPGKLMRLVPFVIVGFFVPIIGGVGVGIQLDLKSMLVLNIPTYLIYAGTIVSIWATGFVPELILPVIAKMVWDTLNLAAAVTIVVAWRGRKKGAAEEQRPLFYFRTKIKFS